MEEYGRQAGRTIIKIKNARMQIKQYNNLRLWISQITIYLKFKSVSVK